MTTTPAYSSTPPALPPAPVFLLRDLAYGGGSRQALELALALMQGGHCAPRLWLLTGGADLLPHAAAQGLETQVLHHGPRITPATLVRLLAQLRRERPPLLLPFGPAANVWGRILGRAAGVPVIVGTLRRSGDARMQWETLLHRLATCVAVNAPSLEAELVRCGVPQAKRRLLPDGVDTTVFVPAAAEAAKLRDPRPHVLCLERLVPGKGQETLLRAMSLVLPEHPRTRLLLVGNGPERERLYRLAERLELGEAVQFLPARQDVTPLYQVADVVAVPALRAGAPRSLLEAMAAALPVVAADVGGVRDFLTDNETGLLYPGDSAEELAERLLRLLRDEALRKRLGAAARARAMAHCTLTQSAQGYAALFRELALP